MVFRIIVKLTVSILAALFAYSLIVVGIREPDNMKLFGGVLATILSISTSISLFLDLKRSN